MLYSLSASHGYSKAILLSKGRVSFLVNCKIFHFHTYMSKSKIITLHRFVFVLVVIHIEFLIVRALNTITKLNYYKRVINTDEYLLKWKRTRASSDCRF